MKQLSIAITTYNRFRETIDSFSEVLDMPEVAEVVIVDDASNDGSFENLQEYFKGNDKVKIYQNETNLGVYFNKKRSVELCNCDWVVVFDSDNIMDKSYVNTLVNLARWDDEVVYQPEFAKPVFDFRAFAGEIVNKYNIKDFIEKPMFETGLNAFNFFVNRKKYLEVFEPSIEPWTSDSIYFALNWFKAGNSYCFVPGLEYIHTIHNNSHYKLNHLKTGSLHEEIVHQLKSM